MGPRAFRGAAAPAARTCSFAGTAGVCVHPTVAGPWPSMGPGCACMVCLQVNALCALALTCRPWRSLCGRVHRHRARRAACREGRHREGGAAIGPVLEIHLS
jgi:hypothetical protein